MRAARPIDEIDRELGDLNRRRAEACDQIHALFLIVIGIESRAEVLLDRRLAISQAD